MDAILAVLCVNGQQAVVPPVTTVSSPLDAMPHLYHQHQFAAGHSHPPCACIHLVVFDLCGEQCGGDASVYTKVSVQVHLTLS